MRHTDLEQKVITAMVGLAGGRSENILLKDLVKELEIPEDELVQELRTLNQSGLVWFHEIDGFKQWHETSS